MRFPATLPAPATGQAKAGMIQLVGLIGFEHVLDIARHPADDLHVQMFRMVEKVRTQGSANQCSDPVFSEYPEPLKRVRHPGKDCLLA